MNKWCPKGKCNCHNYRDNQHGKYCAHSFESVGNFEQCPWPSRQVRVGDSVRGIIECPESGRKIICEKVNQAYDHGRSDMKQEIGAAIEVAIENWPHVKAIAITAIEEVK